jgi:hypothetical protein
VVRDTIRLSCSPEYPSAYKVAYKGNHAGDTKEATNKVDLTKNLSLCLALGIDTRWRMIEEDRQEEADAVPDAHNDTDVSPR